MSDKVGAVLRLSFSSMLPEGSGHDNGTQASLRLAYLKTYEHVGVFSATCVSGCNCTAQKVTARHRIRSYILASHSCHTPNSIPVQFIISANGWPLPPQRPGIRL